MVGWLGRRTEPRVGFRREVRVIWPGQVGSVVARAVNLSPTGILVDAPTPEPCPVGSPVVCDVPLPHGSLRLRGRVAHNRVLSPAKVGMGIAFTDLSPHMVAELRGVVDESDEKAQLVKLRFAGKSQLICTRALPTAEGFQFTTALPFLRADTEVEISLSPDANLATKGWVSSVALGPAQADGIPRLVIDIRAGESAAPRLAPDASVSGEVESPVAAPAPDLGAVPERVWEPWELSANDDAAADLPSTDPRTDAQIGWQPDSFDSAAASGIPTVRNDAEKTEIIRIRDLPARTSRPRAAARARSLGLIGSALAVAAVAVVVAVRVRPPRAAASRPVTAPVIVMMPPVPPAPAAAPVAAASPPITETPPIVEPIAKPSVDPSAAAEPAPPDEAVDTSSEFVVGLVGSLKGAHRYVLHTPDGVAFNLPNAQATMKVGTYRPALKGLRAVWVRELPGGGTHLRFFYTKSRPVPEVHLHTDAVRVAAR
jgi:hypothetical protein